MHRSGIARKGVFIILRAPIRYTGQYAIIIQTFISNSWDIHFPIFQAEDFFLHTCQFSGCEVISHCEFAFSLLGARVSPVNMYLGDWINWPKKFHILCPFSYWIVCLSIVNLLLHMVCLSIKKYSNVFFIYSDLLRSFKSVKFTYFSPISISC